MHGVSKIFMFQYNDCLGSSKSVASVVGFNSVFQYNDCLGSSHLCLDLILLLLAFQYNDCLGSSLPSWLNIPFSN